jgi:hypothetical protein
MSLSATGETVVKLYLAGFNRVPEKSGFEYWSSLLDSGQSPPQILKTVFSLPVVTAIYPETLSDTEFLTAIYNNVFGKQPDASGLAYWLGLLGDGRDRSSLVLTMIDAGLGTPDGTPGKDFVVSRYEFATSAVEEQLSSHVELTVERTQSLLALVSSDSFSAAYQQLGIYLNDDGIPPATLSLSLLQDTGTAGDHVTTNPTLKVSGLENGTTVQWSNDGAHWSTNMPLSVGDNSIQVRQLDTADNASAPSERFTFTWSPQHPSVTSISASSLNGANGFRIDGLSPGIAADAMLHLQVGGAGDVNADGYSDVVVGLGNGVDGFGSTFVVYGAASVAASFDAGHLTLDKLPSAHWYRLDGSTYYSTLGSSVGTAGDFNGDGIADVLVGAQDYGAVQWGAAYVIYGGSEPVTWVDVNLPAYGLKLLGDADRDVFTFTGHSSATAGDVNGDGYDDVILGAPGMKGYESSPGAAFVVFGKAGTVSSVLELADLDGSNGFRIAGTTANEHVGTSVSSAGDINNDGYADLIIGGGQTGEGPGTTYLVYGKASGFPSLLELSSLDGTNGFSILAPTGAKFAGFAVHSAGDVNGDGIADIVIGAPGTDGFGAASGSGAAYVVFGKEGGFGSSISLGSLTGSNGFKIAGAASGDGAGVSVAAAGDVNADGYDDIIVGAPGSDRTFTDGGSAYVIYGKSAAFASSISLASLDASVGFRLNAGNAGDAFGGVVAAAGDVNGDGFDDVLVGAPKASYNSAGSGSAYVFFGGDFTGAVTYTGLATSDTIFGTSSSEVAVGGDGDDTLIGGGGADVLRGGGGDDTFRLSDLDVMKIDGGEGQDTLELGLGVEYVDLGQLRGKLHSIETIDIGDGHDTVLHLSASDVLAMTDATHTLRILAHQREFERDRVDLDGWEIAGWNAEGTVYNQGGATIVVNSDFVF